ncbi:hypothetical protein HaLaN_22989 [Haematococcus lacustris]|uniref:Uncharacterized protein n=1 Tax=Haematococcus lacustris TaxID=44745 RepID=A0A699ZQX1_HAELA|nr:hypothetical protein HaLaN_22989 [Haematococcus lacustris]
MTGSPRAEVAAGSRVPTGSFDDVPSGLGGQCHRCGVCIHQGCDRGCFSLRAIARFLASGALNLASEAMPAQAIADTPQLLTINCISGGVGGPSLSKVTLDIAARCEWKEVSSQPHRKKDPLAQMACCELTNVTFQTFECQLCS